MNAGNSSINDMILGSGAEAFLKEILGMTDTDEMSIPKEEYKKLCTDLLISTGRLMKTHSNYIEDYYSTVYTEVEMAHRRLNQICSKLRVLAKSRSNGTNILTQAEINEIDSARSGLFAALGKANRYLSKTTETLNFMLMTSGSFNLEALIDKAESSTADAPEDIRSGADHYVIPGNTYKSLTALRDRGNEETVSREVRKERAALNDLRDELLVANRRAESALVGD